MFFLLAFVTIEHTESVYQIIKTIEEMNKKMEEFNVEKLLIFF